MFKSRLTDKNLFIALLICFSKLLNAQITNYVSNGGFEDRINCLLPTINTARYWRSIDSIPSSGSPAYYSTCYPNVPSGGLTYQWPHSGNAFGLGTLLCLPPACSSNGNRHYFRNRLKGTLQSGKIYCVKIYINISDPSTYGIDGFGVFFADNSIDTITKPAIPLTYINPQVQNSTNNILSDTMNWVPLTGTFVATGIEKHMVIGNFKSDAATTKTLINSTNLPSIFCDIAIDDVSCIPLDLPAYAGPDVFCIPGNSVYIGRPQDVGIDEACTWYKLPNMSTVIATAAGLTVNPVTTSTYVVKQDICGVIKWDTVVVTMSGAGINEADLLKEHLNIYPVPAKDELNLSFDVQIENTFKKIEIYNELGQMIREEELQFKSNSVNIKTSDLSNGVYFFALKGDGISLSKRFVITK